MITTDYKLGEVCSRLSSGKNIKAELISDIGKYPVFGGNGIRGFTSNYNFEGECAIIGRQGAYCGNVQFYKGRAYMTEHAVVVCGNEKSNTKYLSFVLGSMNLGHLSHQAAQPGLSVKVLAEQKVSLPPIETQKKIADILSAYDDLIENNQKQIKLLEEAAQRLYKEWFVDLHFPGHESTPIIDGIPQGWEMGTLGEIALFKRGKTITKDQTIYGNIPVVAGGLEPAYYHNQANTVAPVITVSGSGANAGFTRLYSVNVWASDCSYVDSQVTNNIYFVYCCLKDKTAELDALQKGAAQPHVYAKDINVIKLLIPNNDLLKQYNEIVECIFKKIKVLEAQNLQLKEARDRLLPKLMNGEIEVGMDKQETAKIDNFDYIRKHWKAVPYDEDLPLAARSTGDISEETLEKLKEIAEEE